MLNLFPRRRIQPLEATVIGLSLAMTSGYNISV